MYSVNWLSFSIVTTTFKVCSEYVDIQTETTVNLLGPRFFKIENTVYCDLFVKNYEIGYKEHFHRISCKKKTVIFFYIFLNLFVSLYLRSMISSLPSPIIYSNDYPFFSLSHPNHERLCLNFAQLRSDWTKISQNITLKPFWI